MIDRISPTKSDKDLAGIKEAELEAENPISVQAAKQRIDSIIGWDSIALKEELELIDSILADPDATDDMKNQAQAMKEIKAGMSRPL